MASEAVELIGALTPMINAIVSGVTAAISLLVLLRQNQVKTELKTSQEEAKVELKASQEETKAEIKAVQEETKAVVEKVAEKVETVYANTNAMKNRLIKKAYHKGLIQGEKNQS